MPTFTPPASTDTPPISVADQFQGPPTSVTNPQGLALMKYYRSRKAGINVFKMSDGSYQIDRQPDTPIPNIVVTEPYPATAPNAGQAETQPNNALNWAWYNAGSTQGTNTYGGLESPIASPYCVLIYYGGSSYQISSAEATALTAAGFGAYIT